VEKEKGTGYRNEREMEQNQEELGQVGGEREGNEGEKPQKGEGVKW